MPPKDHQPPHNHVKSSLLRWVLIGIGWISIAGGIVGIFLPLVPSVPFLLLAAVCFSRSSERFHRWLIEHKHLGPMVRDYLARGSIPLRAKVIAMAMVWTSFPVTTFLFVRAFWLKVLLMALATGVTLYLLYLPTTSPGDAGKERNLEP